MQNTVKATVIIRSLYLYVVCLITLITCLFAGVSGVSAVVDIAYPDPYAGYYNPYPGSSVSEAEVTIDPGAEALWHERERKAQKDSNRRGAVKDLLRSAVVLLFAGPLFAIHYKAASRERGGLVSGGAGA